MLLMLSLRLEPFEVTRLPPIDHSIAHSPGSQSDPNSSGRAAVVELGAGHEGTKLM